MKRGKIGSLEIGDKVVAISMGRKRGILTVSAIEPHGEYPVLFSNSNVRAKNVILSDNKIKVNNPQQATDYYFIS